MYDTTWSIFIVQLKGSYCNTAVWENPHFGIEQMVVTYQCRDFPHSYIVIATIDAEN